MNTLYDRTTESLKKVTDKLGYAASREIVVRFTDNGLISSETPPQILQKILDAAESALTENRRSKRAKGLSIPRELANLSNDIFSRRKASASEETPEDDGPEPKIRESNAASFAEWATGAMAGIY